MKTLFYSLFLVLSVCAVENKKLITEVAFPKLKFDRPIEYHVHPQNTKRAFVIEQRGKAYELVNDASAKKKKLILDISDIISTQNEEGLLSWAFHPDFKNTGRIYLYYTVKKPKRSHVASYKFNGQGKLKLEELILEVAQPYWNHNGGQIAFGPDGYLYIGLGDGGAGGDPKNHGQNMNTLLGSIIRIDVNSTNGNKKYGIPADNPFVGKKGVQPEIFAYGLRNPWRFSFDPKTGDLICADVGQNKQEEVDFIVSGGNYGWRVYEGDSTFKREKPVAGVEYLKPLKAYPRNMGTSITGGFVYRGTKIPSLQGYYIYCDYASNNFWVLKQQRGKLIENHHIGKYRFAVSSFAVDHQGELYLCSFKEGNIVRIVGFE